MTAELARLSNGILEEPAAVHFLGMGSLGDIAHLGGGKKSYYS